ncbi:MAG: tellurite resistance TerB family protein [Gammaproteobacteria bacterium]|nr:tellurite resistance TerB family protein [Gammaproteobacteria bacterium]
MDVNKLLKGLTSSSTAKGLLGGLAGGAVSGALMSKKGRKNAKSLLKLGGIAAVGTLAWKAYQQYQAKQQNGAVSEGFGEQQFHNLETGVDPNQIQALFILKSMVAAAMSDGHIDAKEYQNILERADDAGLSAEDKNLVFAEIQQPMSIAQLSQRANSPELAMEVYTASLLVIDETQPQAKAYLTELAQALKLPAPLVEAVHQQVQN